MFCFSSKYRLLILLFLQMLTFASTSSDLLLPMPSSSSLFDNIVNVKPFYNKMLFSEVSSSDSTTISTDFANDSGFFDDSETSCIAYDIGTKLAAMCDDFDAQMMSYSSQSHVSRSLFDRVLDFFAF
uniref:Ovule protein n=2 Tax=Caenorhabditis tropicalis TaxID=1561998 RepID=A0A1I7UVW1_9PELO